jgi:P4 family phage/plasmid primase-like protien
MALPKALADLYKFMRGKNNKWSDDASTGKGITHTLMASPFGKFNIPDNKRSKFIEYYVKAIVAGCTPSVIETRTEYGPILVDFDFVQSENYPARQYNRNIIGELVIYYIEAIKQYLNANDSQIHAYVYEKKEPQLRNKKYHDGLHIIFPYICTKPDVQFAIRKCFIDKIVENEVLSGMELVTDVDTIVDQAVISQTGWLMYGSSKGKGFEPYEITYIYAMNGNKLKNILGKNTNKKSADFIKTMVIDSSRKRFINHKKATPLLPDIDLTELANIAGDKNKVKAAKKANKNEKNKSAGNKAAANLKFVYKPEDIINKVDYEEARVMVKLLSDERSVNYQDWYQIGLCLRSVDACLLQTWKEFSAKCPEKYKEHECELLWSKMKPETKRIATLHYMAQQDSPKEYILFRQTVIDKVCEEMTTVTHTDIANLLVQKNKFVYKCGSISKNIWYEFRDHRWRRIDCAHTLYLRIADDVIHDLIKQRKTYATQMADVEGSDATALFQKIQKMDKNILAVKDVNFKNNVIKDCAKQFYDPDFMSRLDENIYLLGFENGVWDMEADIFRQGYPDDYISMSTKINCYEYDHNDQAMIDLKDFLNKIQPDPEMYTCLMRILGYCLSGSVSEENMYVFTGTGANGKSKLMELLGKTMGDYLKAMDILVLTGKRTNASNATPEIVDKKGARGCHMNEPSQGDKINTGFMKLINGGDELTGRALYGDTVYFKPQFKPFLLCNHLPEIESDDDGTWRRIRVISFESKFLIPDVYNKIKKKSMQKNTFIADDRISDKIPEWKEAFMSLLMNAYREYKLYGIPYPEKVLNETKEYRNRCDSIQGFMEDCLESTENKNDIIHLRDLRPKMMDWIAENTNNGKTPNNKELHKYLVNKYSSRYNVIKKYLTGYVFSVDEDDIDVVDADEE